MLPCSLVVTFTSASVGLAMNSRAFEPPELWVVVTTAAAAAAAATATTLRGAQIKLRNIMAQRKLVRLTELQSRLASRMKVLTITLTRMSQPSALPR